MIFQQLYVLKNYHLTIMYSRKSDVILTMKLLIFWCLYYIAIRKCCIIVNTNTFEVFWQRLIQEKLPIEKATHRESYLEPVSV